MCHFFYCTNGNRFELLTVQRCLVSAWTKEEPSRCWKPTHCWSDRGTSPWQHQPPLLLPGTMWWAVPRALAHRYRSDWVGLRVMWSRPNIYYHYYTIPLLKLKWVHYIILRENKALGWVGGLSYSLPGGVTWCSCLLPSAGSHPASPSERAFTV